MPEKIHIIHVKLQYKKIDTADFASYVTLCTVHNFIHKIYRLILYQSLNAIYLKFLLTAVIL